MAVTTASLAYGLVIMFFSSVLCSSAGVGGGSLNVPILYSIIGFDYDTAVILSLCTLMGNYLLQVLVNLDKRHPNEPRLPLIYWDAVLIIFPSLLGGANFGVVVAKSMPKTLVFLLAIGVLVLAVYFTGKKGLMLRKKETLLIEEELNSKSYDVYSNHSPLLGDAADNSSGASAPRHMAAKKAPIVTISSIIPPYLCCYYSLCRRFGADKSGASKKSSKGSSGATHSALNTSEVVTSFDEEDGESFSELSDPLLPPIEFPWKIIAVIACVFVMYLACYVVQKEYEPCTTGNNVSLALIYVLLVFQITWGLRYLITQYNKKLSGAWAEESLPGSASAHKGLVEGEIHWDLQSVVVPLTSFLIGTTSSLLGIGGGELMGPMLLMFKVLAPVSTATTSFMSFLNTSSSVAHYLVLGDVPFGYGAAVFVVGAFGGITGRVMALYFVAHYKRASYLIFSLVCVLSCSIFIYLYYIIDYKTDFTFGSICSR